MRNWSQAEFDAEANRLSNVLAAMGVMRGDAVALDLPLGVRAAVALQACRQMGAVAVLPEPTCDAIDAAALAGVRVAIAAGERLERLARSESLPALRFLIDADAAAAKTADRRLRRWAELLEHAAPGYPAIVPDAAAAALRG